MPRPSCCRTVHALPAACRFVPTGVLRCDLEEIVLSVDEFEALRLADLEGLYQDAAAGRMGISRQTFGRIIELARRKVAEALVQAKALKIEGGAFVVSAGQAFECTAPCQGHHPAGARQEACDHQTPGGKPCQRRGCCKTKRKGQEK